MCEKCHVWSTYTPLDFQRQSTGLMGYESLSSGICHIHEARVESQILADTCTEFSPVKDYIWSPYSICLPEAMIR